MVVRRIAWAAFGGPCWFSSESSYGLGHWVTGDREGSRGLDVLLPADCQGPRAPVNKGEARIGLFE